MGIYGHFLSLTKNAFFVLCMYRGIQTYGGCPNIWGCTNILGHKDTPKYVGHPNMGVFKNMGCPNIQGISKHIQGVSKHMGGIQTYGRCPNIQGASKYVGVSKHMGHPNIWGCPKIQGHPNICGIKIYRGHPNIQGPSCKAGFATSIYICMNACLYA